MRFDPQLATNATNDIMLTTKISYQVSNPSLFAISPQKSIYNFTKNIFSETPLVHLFSIFYNVSREKYLNN